MPMKTTHAPYGAASLEGALDSQAYATFLGSKTAWQWNKIGIHRRSGVLAPLFSIHSQASTGCGELPDIKLLADWCAACGMSVIQLLPLNILSGDFSPYSCQSTFALEPLYLRLSELKAVDLGPFGQRLDGLKQCYKPVKRVNYAVRQDKLNLLREIFPAADLQDPAYSRFKSENRFWLEDYSLFRVLKEATAEQGWESWDPAWRAKQPEALAALAAQKGRELEFHKWLQWQIFEQLKEAKAYANRRGVLIQGDLPFLVARDSADVWGHQDYFKLDVSSGAPPDMYFAKGQRWGMPTYQWDAIEANGFDYIKEKIRFAQNFYDLFRIDHFVGLFRLWTIRLDEPADTYGLNGRFDPEDPGLWKEHGQKILRAMTENTDMLPCAEDLGVVPDCSYETLREFGIPGLDVQRWNRDWGKTYDFRKPEQYRENSIAILSSHDTSPLVCWWEQEASTVDALLVDKICKEKGWDTAWVCGRLFDPASSTASRLRWQAEVRSPEQALGRLGKSRDEAWPIYDLHRESFDEKQKFWQYLGLPGLPSDTATPEFVSAALQQINTTKSVFAIQLIQDWLCLGPQLATWDRSEMRVNTPGTLGPWNWSLILPQSLETLMESDLNHLLMAINQETFRVPPTIPS